MAVLNQFAASCRSQSNSLPVVLGIFVAFLFLFTRYLYRHLTNDLNKIPGPFISKWTNLPLKLATISGRRMYHVHHLHQQYGHYVRLSPTEVSVSDPNAFAQIHKIGSGFTKSDWYAQLTSFERPTLFTMTDSRMHGARRKLMARAFSKTYLRDQWEIVVREKISLCVGKMIEESRKEGSVDMLKWWTLMATDVSTHLMFGDSFHMIEAGQKNDYIRGLESALQGGGIGVELPLVRAVGKYLPFEPFKSLFGANVNIMQKAEMAVRGASAMENHRNLFAHIIHEAQKGEQLDNTDVKLEATGLIVAGSDTTAVTTTYLIWAVLTHDNLLPLLQEELSKLPENYRDRDLEELPLLNAIIEETLRLYGAAPGGTPRTMPTEGSSLGGFYIPPGTIVTTQAYTLHRDDDIFPNPYTFDHTRWLPNSDIESSTRKSDSELAKVVFSPFGAGARTCIGVHLARMELRLAVAEFFRSCNNISLASSTTTETMEMENFFLIAPKAHRCDIVCH